jgi:hypothetical protein
MSQGAPQKRYGLFSLAILLLLLGGASLFLGSRTFVIRSLGALACIASVYLIRMSNVRARPFSVVSGQIAGSTRLPGRLTWSIGAVSLLLAGASFLYLYNDALHGYQEVLPVYVFAGTALACALVWSYLVSRFFQ